MWKYCHIHELYNTGHKNEAIAKILGISTELVVVAYLIETFGIGELFVSSISFQNNWAIQMAQATIGVLISSKIALFLGEKVEEAAEEKLHHHWRKKCWQSIIISIICIIGTVAERFMATDY